MADNYQQLNLFNEGKDYFKITKPIRLIELFAGIGAQAKALEVLGVPFEHYKICEWAIPSIKAYNSIHIKDFTDYSQGLTKKELIDYLQGNISVNYNDPCDVSRKPEKWLRDTYNNCIATHNLMNIMKVKGSDLNIVDTDKYCYILTYSFPCQDLSLAGKRQGMEISQADGGTRSGLLWEVERILDELKRDDNDLPQILLMENVPEVCGAGNVKHFNKWMQKLESLGYTNRFEILNAKDYGIPQNRRRCFMVSVLGDYAYDFPLKIKLKYKLKDFLEKQVDEKYYLSDKMIEYISATGTKDFSVNNSQINCSNARPLTTEQNKRAGTTNYICSDLPEDTDLRKVGNVGNGHHSKDVYSTETVMPTLTTGNHNNGQLIVDNEGEGGVMIKENNSQGYKIAQLGDGVNLASRMKHQRGNVQKGSIQTLKTEMEIGVVVEDNEKK